MTSPLSAAVAQAKRDLELQWATEEERELELTEVERHKRDPIGWLNSGEVWIASKFSDTGKLRPLRLKLFPDQERTVEAWIDLDHLRKTGELVWRNVVIEKTRQIGETWLFAAVLCWALHYHTVNGLAMHTKGAKIDDGGTRNTVDSLFGRIRYIDRRLDRRKVNGLGRLAFRPFSRDPAKVENLDNGAVLLGEGQTDDPGRGGTFDLVLVDEAAFVEHGERVYAAIDDACPDGKALLSTVNGDDNFHARIADEQPEGWTYLRLHWSTHPHYSVGLHVAGQDPDCLLCQGNERGLVWTPKEPRAHRFPGKLTSPYYDRAVIGKTIEQVANELDIDREGALGGRVFAEFETAIHMHRDNRGREAVIPYDPLLPTELAWDYGLDCTSVVICQDAPSEYRVIGEVELLDKPGVTVVPNVVADAVRAELRELMLDGGETPERVEIFLTGEWTRKLYARGDPAGHARALNTGRSLVADYDGQGFRIGKPPTHMSRTVEPSIRAVKRLLLGTPKPVRVSSRCQLFKRHMANNVWPTDALGKRRIGATTPLDNEHNHMARAFAYLIVSKFPPAVNRGALSGEEWPEREKVDPLEKRRRARHGADFPDPEDTLGYDSAM